MLELVNEVRSDRFDMNTFFVLLIKHVCLTYCRREKQFFFAIQIGLNNKFIWTFQSTERFILNQASLQINQIVYFKYLK